MANLYSDFDLFITVDGIYLRLNCTDKSVSNMENIDRYLVSSGIKIYDKTILKENLDKFEAATFKLCNATVDTVDEHVLVTVSEDEMTAYVEFMPPSSNGKAITEQGVKEQLEDAGVFVGIYEDRIGEIIEERSYFEPYEIAKGIEPIEGTPAFIEYKFDTTKTNERKPKENADGSVDYYNMDIINPVRQGDLLATVEPAIPGIDGKTVTGKDVAPDTNLNEDLTIFGGRNVKLSEDKKQAYAGTDGQALLKDSRVNVEDVYFVSGDVDGKSGNIAFNGNVMISGNVRSGFKIEATGDIQINGTVEGAYIHSDKSVLVKGGIQGMSKASIYAAEDIRCKFIENAEIVCGGNLETGTVLYCNIIARNNVELIDKRGYVIGGTITAGREIMCKNVGSEMGSMTILQVGRNGSVRTMICQVTEDVTLMENKRRNILKVIKFYKGKISNGDEVSKEEIQKLKELVNEQGRMAKVITNKNAMIKILKEIMEQQEEGKTDRIVCINELGTNVKLCVNGAATITRQEYKTVRIIKHKGDIRIAYYAPDDEFID